MGKSKQRRLTKLVYVVQGYYSQGWEDVTAEEKYSEAKKRLREYEANEPQYSHRIPPRRKRVEVEDTPNEV